MGSCEDESELERRQWLFDHLADLSGGGSFPPRALVDALNLLDLGKPFDLGWATAEFDHRTEVTTWTGLVANAAVLVEFDANAGPADGHPWNGNSIRQRVVYNQEPVVDVEVVRLEDVSALHVKSMGDGDAAEHGQRLRQEWTFTFADGTSRTYATDVHAQGQPADLQALCQRLAQHL